MRYRGEPATLILTTDIGVPGSRLWVAAVSQQHCIVSYESGGYTVRHKMTIFEFSNSAAKVIFDGPGGNWTIAGLKETIKPNR